MVWERNEDGSWSEQWSRRLRERGWRSVSRVQWGSGGARLLLAGLLAVVARWELLVLQQDEDSCSWRVESRAGCGAGAAGCWAGTAGRAYLALELRHLAAGHYATVVWLNSATQETQSEYAGVRTPLLRIYNQDRANITHIAVAEAPLEEHSINYDDEESQDQVPTLQILLAGFSGSHGVLRVWPLSALQPPPLLASGAGDLRERVRRRDAAAAAAAAAVEDGEEEEEPDEMAVRAMCTPHEYECRLESSLIGLTVQPDCRCAWACTSGARVTCVSLPSLTSLRQLPAPPAPPRPLASAAAAATPTATPDDLHYVYPDISNSYFATPAGARSGLVWTWSLGSGAPSATPLAHPAPALVALSLPPLPRTPHSPATHQEELLVVAGDHIYIWKSCATPQSTPASEDDGDLD